VRVLKTLRERERDLRLSKIKTRNTERIIGCFTKGRLYIAADMGSGVFKAWREREREGEGGRVAISQSVFCSSHVE
jgi:hypothetical protein